MSGIFAQSIFAVDLFAAAIFTTELIVLKQFCHKRLKKKKKVTGWQFGLTLWFHFSTDKVFPFLHLYNVQM